MKQLAAIIISITLILLSSVDTFAQTERNNKLKALKEKADKVMSKIDSTAMNSGEKKKISSTMTVKNGKIHFEGDVRSAADVDTVKKQKGDNSQQYINRAYNGDMSSYGNILNKKIPSGNIQNKTTTMPLDSNKITERHPDVIDNSIDTIKATPVITDPGVLASFILETNAYSPDKAFRSYAYKIAELVMNEDYQGVTQLYEGFKPIINKMPKYGTEEYTLIFKELMDALSEVKERSPNYATSITELSQPFVAYIATNGQN